MKCLDNQYEAPQPPVDEPTIDATTSLKPTANKLVLSYTNVKNETTFGHLPKAIAFPAARAAKIACPFTRIALVGKHGTAVFNCDGTGTVYWTITRNRFGNDHTSTFDANTTVCLG